MKQGASKLNSGVNIAVTNWAWVDQILTMQTMLGTVRTIKPALP